MKKSKRIIGAARLRTRAVVVASSLSGLLLLGACIAPIKAQQDFKYGAAIAYEERATWRLAQVQVEIPEELQVSTDPTRRYPDPDKIVWYGDGPGDVSAQVRDLVSTGIHEGAAGVLLGEKPVHILVRLRQFHAMTPRARVSNLQLGVHEISFDVEVRTAKGELLVSEANVSADLDAYSGVKAFNAEARGETQRVRITRRINEVIRNWLGAGSGHLA